MKKHKVYLQELSAEFSEADYSKFYEVVMRRIENGELVPMKSAKNNGRKPALPLCFWEYEKEADHTELYEELKRIERLSEENEQLLYTLQLVAETLNGMKEDED